MDNPNSIPYFAVDDDPKLLNLKLIKYGFVIVSLYFFTFLIVFELHLNLIVPDSVIV